MNLLSPLLEAIRSHDLLLWWLVAASLAMFLATPIVVGWIVIGLPPDYFRFEHRAPNEWRRQHPWLWPLVFIAKNLLGLTLIVAGLAMLVVPGQGLLTLVVGVGLIDFPGKPRLLRWLETRRSVWRSMNWLRQCAGRPAFLPPG